MEADIIFGAFFFQKKKVNMSIQNVAQLASMTEGWVAGT
jgi:hypothetical protein